MKGRKPKPTEQKRREGNLGKRPLGDPVNVGERLQADDDFEDALGLDGELVDDGPELDEPAEPSTELAAPVWMPALPDTLALLDELEGEPTARSLWDEVCRLLVTSNIITEGDLFAVEQFVMATLEARRAFFELRTDGSTIDTVNPSGGRAGKTTHPAYRVWRDSNATMLKWGEHLGLTPVARARLGLAVGHGRKLAQELNEGLPKNPLVRTEGSGDADAEAHEIDPYGGEA